jgi:methylthioribose-1-phosphate isomerase
MKPLIALPTVRFANGKLRIIDQTLLPSRYEIVSLNTVDGVCDAIARLRVRGAPAIGVAAAYGLLVAVEETWGHNTHIFDSGINDAGEAHAPKLDMPGVIEAAALRATLDSAADRIVATRPTAVNLAWAVKRMRAVWQDEDDAHEICRRLITEADAILREDLEMGRAMTSHGAALLKDGDSVLTHCNTGGLCAGGIGTALGVIFAAVANGAKVSVFADETRPLLQGARPHGVGMPRAWHSRHGARGRRCGVAPGVGPGLLRHGGCGSHRAQRRHCQQDRHTRIGDRRETIRCSSLRGGSHEHD